MPSWGAAAFGVILSGILAAVALAPISRERRASVLAGAALAACLSCKRLSRAGTRENVLVFASRSRGVRAQPSDQA